MRNKIFVSIVLLIIIFPKLSFSQKDNLVRDSVLYNDLYSFLITRVTDYLVDSLGNKQPAYIKGEIMIGTSNLRTDSILSDKQIIGLYSTRFACLDCGSNQELYFQHKKRREFLTIDKKTNPFDLIKQIQMFFNLYPNEFTEIEKIKTLKGALEVLETRETRPQSDW